MVILDVDHRRRRLADLEQTFLGVCASRMSSKECAGEALPVLAIRYRVLSAIDVMLKDHWDGASAETVKVGLVQLAQELPRELVKHMEKRPKASMTILTFVRWILDTSPHTVKKLDSTIAASPRATQRWWKNLKNQASESALGMLNPPMAESSL
jgi:hypothetical protein